MLLLLAANPVVSHAQREGGIRVAIYPARDSAAYGYVEEFFQRSNVLEAVAWELEDDVELPGRIQLAAGECGHSGAPFHAAQRMVLVCYELIDTIFRASRRLSGTAEERSQAVSFMAAWIVYRQLAYPLIEWFGIDSRYAKDVAAERQSVPERMAEVFATAAIGDTWRDGGLARTVQGVKSQPRMAVALFPTAFAAVSEPGVVVSSGRLRSLTCLLFGGNFDRYPALGQLVPASERASCRQQAGSMFSGYHGFVFEHSIPWTGDRSPAGYRANFSGPWRGPSAPRPRARADGLDVSRFPDGGWWFKETLGGAAGCILHAGTIDFSTAYGRPTGDFRGFASCELFPNGRGTRGARISTIYTSGSSLYFVAGGCHYSGWSRPGQILGSVRCDVGTNPDGSIRSIRGTWQANSMISRPPTP